MLKCKVDYPTEIEEREILLRQYSQPSRLDAVATSQDLLRCKEAVTMIHFDPLILDYVLSIVRKTRGEGHIAAHLSVGASPRASLAMMNGARALAFLKRRPYVTPDDVKLVAHDVLRHRLMLSFEAEAKGLTPEWVIDKILQTTRAP